MKLAIFKATVTSPFGKFVVAVESNSYDARTDIRTAALSELRCNTGLLRIGDITKSSRRILQSMDDVRLCEWAWIRKSK
jgi:hypothetical protein